MTSHTDLLPVAARAVPALLSDAGRMVVAVSAVPVPGARRIRRGWLVEVRPAGTERLGRHGRHLVARIGAVLVLGALCAILTAAGRLVEARVVCLAVLAAFVWLGVAYRRTNRLAALMASPSALTSAEERADLREGVRLAERIWADRIALRELATTTGETGPLLGHAILDLAAVLVRRQRLREIWDGMDRLDDAGLPDDSPAVLAARQQGERADALWADLDREVRLHLTALRATAETGAGLVREIALGDAARRTRVALDSLGPAAPADAPVVAGLGPFVSAYRDLASRYGRDLYS